MSASAELMNQRFKHPTLGAIRSIGFHPVYEVEYIFDQESAPGFCGETAHVQLFHRQAAVLKTMAERDDPLSVTGWGKNTGRITDPGWGKNGSVGWGRDIVPLERGDVICDQFKEGRKKTFIWKGAIVEAVPAYQIFIEDDTMRKKKTTAAGDLQELFQSAGQLRALPRLGTDDDGTDDDESSDSDDSSESSDERGGKGGARSSSSASSAAAMVPSGKGRKGGKGGSRKRKRSRATRDASTAFATLGSHRLKLALCRGRSPGAVPTVTMTWLEDEDDDDDEVEEQ